ncbi:MAG: hypothetical protein PHY64_05425 [Eubacteriales bacterium]|nr:hypothetical protein [Eubacteriales bacterium]
MKRVCLLLTVVLVLLIGLPAQADEAGVLTETELGTWLNGLLLSTKDVQPINAPVGEDALTGDGYAFIYDTATLYYNKPVLDAQSVLNAVAVTDASLAMPRSVTLNAPAAALLAAYGWQNPSLSGDDSFAPLYVLNQLPQAAYWALAQRSGNTLQSVQCAIHVLAGDDRYTDAGVLYTVTDGAVNAIRVYGFNTYITQAEVQGNLAAVGGGAQQTEGVTLVSDAEAFGQSDLQFGKVDFLTLTASAAQTLFGAATDENWAQDDTGEWLHSLTTANAALVFVTDANRQNERLESITLTGGESGPRGLAAGMTLNDAMALFRSDGDNRTADGAALLYGDGQNLPYGTLERGGGYATLHYTASVPGADGAPLTVALHLTFINDLLTEMMLYSL